MLKALVRSLLYRRPVYLVLCHRLLQPAWLMLQKLALFGMNYGGGNTVADSGELWVLQRIDRVLRRRTAHQAVIFDVGANSGEYAKAVRETLGPGVRLVCFEPSPTSFATLSRNFGSIPNVLLANIGLSDREGTANLFAQAPGSVVSSLYSDTAALQPSMSETDGCRLTTLDAYCEANAISHIDLLKIDSEGHEAKVLEGAQRMLTAGAIDYIQFEFGPPQINARSFFRDLFVLLTSRYRIYRILRAGLAPIDTYDEIREVFRTSNFLAIARRLGENPGW